MSSSRSGVDSLSNVSMHSWSVAHAGSSRGANAGRRARARCTCAGSMRLRRFVGHLIVSSCGVYVQHVSTLVPAASLAPARTETVWTSAKRAAEAAAAATRRALRWRPLTFTFVLMLQATSSSESRRRRKRLAAAGACSGGSRHGSGCSGRSVALARQRAPRPRRQGVWECGVE